MRLAIIRSNKTRLASESTPAILRRPLLMFVVVGLCVLQLVRLPNFDFQRLYQQRHNNVDPSYEITQHRKTEGIDPSFPYKGPSIRDEGREMLISLEGSRINSVILDQKIKSHDQYNASVLEDYVLEHAIDLGYDASGSRLASGCEIWRNTSVTKVFAELQTFRRELQDYHERLHRHNGTTQDLRLLLRSNEQQQQRQQHDICHEIELHPDGLDGIFKSRKSLSRTMGAGYIEPLLPPLRQVDFCFPGGRKHLLSLKYLIHDFGHLCRSLKPSSRTVFIDMGASLQFHRRSRPPALQLIELYHKFGFRFDHIYAYEITKTDPAIVFQSIPDALRPAYHWINVGVSAAPDSPLNPLKMILDHYTPDDLIVVKLDIDTTAVEVPLAEQLKDMRFSQRIDVFYFEHHVRVRELAPYWQRSMHGTLLDSLQLFRDLRENGIAAHAWV